jgi:hypothetical protein
MQKQVCEARKVFWRRSLAFALVDFLVYSGSAAE